MKQESKRSKRIDLKPDLAHIVHLIDVSPHVILWRRQWAARCEAELPVQLTIATHVGPAVSFGHPVGSSGRAAAQALYGDCAFKQSLLDVSRERGPQYPVVFKEIEANGHREPNRAGNRALDKRVRLA